MDSKVVPARGAEDEAAETRRTPEIMPPRLGVGPRGRTLKDVISESETKIAVNQRSFFYGAKQALFDISLRIPKGRVTAFIGPCGACREQGVKPSGRR